MYLTKVLLIGFLFLLVNVNGAY